MMTYNYDRFDTRHYDFFAFPGPRPGEQATDFSVFDLTGEPVSLQDFRGKWLVIETGSVTCNMYSRNIEHMNALRDKYPDVEFVVVYVREAHPGNKLPQHPSFKEKLNNAADLVACCGEQRSILVDDWRGSMHTAFGSMPNMVYVIAPDGEVVYRHNWGNPEELDKVLANRSLRITREHATTWEMKPWSYRTTVELFKTVGRGGRDAIWDLVKAMPSVIWAHLKADFQDWQSRRAPS
jgi:peroxiredoxin